MASPLVTIFTLLTMVSPSFGLTTVNTAAIKNTLVPDFYKTKCPNVEQIVLDVVTKKTKETPGFIPGLIRLHFHDCFITGCDASILLTPQRYNHFAAEIAHPLNGLGMRGMNVIDEIKAELESKCPGVVSCADIIAYAARDAVVLAGNPRYSIPAGRRDGSNVDGSQPHGLPAASYPVDLLTEMYAEKGLTKDDLIVLEGAHSIGQSKCSGSIVVKDVVLNATGSEQVINQQFKNMVQQKYCPPKPTPELDAFHVPLNPEKIDTAWGVTFFNNLMQGKGILPSDLAMFADSTTHDLVLKYAANQTLWAQAFNDAMTKIGKINVKTGEEGDIRKQCSVLNSVYL